MEVGVNSKNLGVLEWWGVYGGSRGGLQFMGVGVMEEDLGAECRLL